MLRIAATAVVLLGLLAPAARAEVDLQALNRAVNHSHPLVNRVLPWDQEGKPGYDCKGFVALKIKALEAAGFSDDDMAVLIVDNGTRNTNHSVLLLKAEGVVMDDMNGWLGRESDYKTLARWPADWWVQAFEHGGQFTQPAERDR